MRTLPLNRMPVPPIIGPMPQYPGVSPRVGTTSTTRQLRSIARRSAPANPPALPDPATGDALAVSEASLWGVWTDVRRTVLDGGIRVVSARLPRSGSVSVAVGIGVGSRHEPPALSGISHVLEHMVFRGSERWPTSFDLTAAIENAGGTLDGYTHREATVYYSRLPRPHMAHALEIIFDMVRRPRLSPEDFLIERDVVIEEIKQDAQASPVVAEEALDSLLWPDHPLSRSPAGKEATVAALATEDVRRVWEWAYAPAHTVVSVAGDVDHQEVCDLVAGLVEGWAPGQGYPPEVPMAPEPALPGLDSRWAEGQTAYVYAGVRGVPSTHPDRPALELLSCAVGELASSRLWADLRDARGLAYDVGSEVTSFADSGALRMWAGVPPKRQAEAVERMLAQAAGARKGLLPEEFSRAKNFVVGELTMACETSEDMAHWLLWGDLAHRRLIPPGAVRATYEQLTPADIERAAALWAPERVQIAIAGPAPRRGARLVKLVQAQSASVSDPSASVAPVAHTVRPRSRRA